MIRLRGMTRGRRAPSTRSDIQRRRLTAAALAGVVCLATGAVVFAWYQYDDGKTHAENELRARVVLAATVFDTYFSGELTALTSIAAAPTIRAGDVSAIQSYLERVQPPKGKAFTGGVGWVDRSGRLRASNSPSSTAVPIDVSERAYFRAVMATGKPFVSGGVVSKVRGRRVIVMAVPTRDPRGRISGVLAGGLKLQQSRTSKEAIDLGYAGLVVVDRNGRELTLKSFPRPGNTSLLGRMRHRQSEVLVDTAGLTGDHGRVVAYATSPIPRWIIVIDRSSSAVFGAARRTLVYELVSIAFAALVILTLIGWASRRARRAAAEQSSRTRLWSRLTRTLAEASSPSEVAEALAGVLFDMLPGSRVLVALRNDGGSDLRIFARRGAGLDTVAGRRPPLLGPARAAFADKQPIVLEDTDSVRGRFPALQDASSPLHVRALFALPVVVRSGRAVGAVLLLFDERRSPGENERALITAFVEQAAHTLTRTLRQERDHDVAVTLQRSLLPTRLPSVEGIGLAARYQAGGDGLEVGGDWYATVPRPDGILHVSVGDVVGRGIPAATLMAQLRHTYRAYAFEHDSPAEIARRLIRHVPDNEMVTLVCLAIDPYTRRFRYTHAGHPPAIVVDGSTGAVSLLDGRGSPPLGFVDAAAVREQSGTLPEEAIVVAYTDGLVERRGASIDDGIERLASLVASVSEQDVEEIAEAVLKTVIAGSDREDDAAFIVLRCAPVPSRLDVRLSADPSLMAPLRRRLQQWLSLRGVDHEAREDTILAVHEVCINAIEHGYNLKGGTIHLVIEHEGDTLRIRVEDRGSWVPGAPGPNRGRGTLIMQKTMEDVRIVHDEEGTTVAFERRAGGRESDFLDGPISTAS